ncbi:MAG: MBL fold metallo-hydrolase [Candidatus Hodarchaeota archaeon]
MVNCKFLGNACIEIISQQDHIVIDPVYIVSPQKGIERIFITHHHQDHINPEKIEDLKKNYVNNEQELEIYGPECLCDEVSIEFILIIPEMTVDLNNGIVSVLENQCWMAEDCVAYLISINGKNILHTADSSIFSSQLKTLRNNIDLCFIACFEENFKNYLEFIEQIHPNLVVPYHFNKEKEEEAKKLERFLNDHKIKARYLPIGEELEI